MAQNIIGLDNDTIINAVKTIDPNIGNCDIIKSNTKNSERYISVSVTISVPQTKLKLIEKVFTEDDAELHRYGFVKNYNLAVPQIYHIDLDKKIILMEDLSENYIQGNNFNEENENGDFIRKNHNLLITTAAKFHAAFWENYSAYNCLCETVKDYPFEMLLDDYKISIMENMFFTIRHINRKIYDFSMRDKAMRAFKTFVLGME